MNRCGITGYGAYLPRLRLQREAVKAAAGWVNPALYAVPKGANAMAHWDEDSVTMAVEAARDCLGGHDDRAQITALYFASTRPPFAERLNAGIVNAALRLPETVEAVDIASTQRAGTSAVLQALSHIGSAAPGEQALVTAGHLHHAPAASVEGLRSGDGAAALRLGTKRVIAEFIASYTETIDFVDRYRGAGAEFGGSWEERWVRDEGYKKIVPRVISKALEKAGVPPEEIAHVVFACPVKGVSRSVVNAAGIAPRALAETWEADCGNCGTAHAIMVLADVLENARPNAWILVIDFGQGCDGLVFRTTAEIRSFRPRHGLRGYLEAGKPEHNYFKYLNFRDLVKWEKGPRAHEADASNLSTLYRNRDFVMGLTGLVCEETGQIFFGPEASFKAARSNQRFNKKSFADSHAKIVAWSSDYLSFTPDPPACYGDVTFGGGGRLSVDFTDVDPAALAIGADMDMVFRIKAKDETHGFTRYVWKAAPALATE